tara:strand:+ start:994 stop:1389 length:396 start_codon:yes stop_codon:yes gene_type:complete
MKVKDLKKILAELEQEHGNIDECDVNYRRCDDSEVFRINHLEEDLFDAETNNVLDSVVFTSNTASLIWSQDYVLYDRANDSLVKFSSGDIVLYGDKKEAEEDCYGNEEVLHFEQLPETKQKEIIHQLGDSV